MKLNKKPWMKCNTHAATDTEKVKTHCYFTNEFAAMFPKYSKKKGMLIEKGVRIAMDQNPNFKKEIESLK